MRSAGCVYNDIVDRDLDRQVERTRLRPLASGGVVDGRLGPARRDEPDRPRRAAPARPHAPRSSPSPASLLVAAYPFMKRITWWPQAWLGLVFSWGALVGWPAVTGRIGRPALLLYAGAIFWVIGYDTIYALQDREDDALVGVRRRRAPSAGTPGWASPSATRSPCCCGRSPSARCGRRIALLGLLPVALHLFWQVATLDPDDGADALAKFRSNRFAGLLMFLACLVLGTA